MERSNVIIDGKEYSIYSNWLDMPYSFFCKVIEASEQPFEKRLSVYTGISEDVLTKLSLSQISFLCDTVSFMDNYENALLFVKDYSDDLSIAKKTYGQLEQAKTLLQYKKPLLALSGIVELYYGEKIDNVPIVDSLGRGLALLTKIDDFLKGFKELYNYEPTPEEIEAGVEDLGKLGSFYTVKKLSDKYCKHPDEILNWEAGVAYAILKADAIEAQISRNMQKIAMRKK